MIQDIAPHVFYNTYQANACPKAKDVLLIYRECAFLVKIESETHGLDLPRVGELAPEEWGKLVFLFKIDDEAFYLWDQAQEPVGRGEQSLLLTYTFYSLKKLRPLGLQPRHYVFALFTASHLAEWYKSHRFCGCCGQPTSYDEMERALSCSHCGKLFYPRINPAVIVGVINDDRLLVTRYRQGFTLSALIAGFTEIGETLEETVAREVMEEVGLRVKNIRYYKSQPWGIAEDLLAGFYCDLDGDATIHLEENELKEAAWLRPEEIVLHSQDYSLTNEMMSRFKAGEPC